MKFERTENIERNLRNINWPVPIVVTVLVCVPGDWRLIWQCIVLMALASLLGFLLE